MKCTEHDFSVCLLNTKSFFHGLIPFFISTKTFTTLKDIVEVFFHRNIPIKHLKRNMKANSSPGTLVTFSLVGS